MPRRRRQQTEERPLLLAVDTSTLTLSIAVTRGLSLKAEIALALPRGHSRALLETLTNLLKSCGETIENVDAFAIGRGPGSFTGLRIGMALLKGLALGYDTPLFGGSSLEAAAGGLSRPDNSLVCVCVDARKGEVYTALYRMTGNQPRMLTDELVIPPRRLSDELLFAAPGNEPIEFLGTGAQVYRDVLESAFGGRALFVDPDHAYPSALHLARQAYRALKNGEEPPSLSTLEPRYIRPSDAELGNPGQKK